MTTIQTKILACFMGFAVLNIFNIHNSFAGDRPNANSYANSHKEVNVISFYKT